MDNDFSLFKTKYEVIATYWLIQYVLPNLVLAVNIIFNFFSILLMQEEKHELFLK